jgi:hypothetical protein
MFFVHTSPRAKKLPEQMEQKYRPVSGIRYTIPVEWKNGNGRKRLLYQNGTPWVGSHENPVLLVDELLDDWNTARYVTQPPIEWSNQNRFILY